MLDAASQGLLGAVRHFLKADPKCVEKADGCGQTALHKAALGGHWEIAELLLQHGSQVQAKDKAPPAQGDVAELLCGAPFSGGCGGAV